MTVTILNNPETQLPGTQPGPVERSVSVTSCKPLVFPDILFGRRLLAAQLQSQDFALIAFPIRQRDSINVLLDLTNENVGVSRRNAADGLLGIEEQFAVARPRIGIEFNYEPVAVASQGNHFGCPHADVQIRADQARPVRQCRQSQQFMLEGSYITDRITAVLYPFVTLVPERPDVEPAAERIDVDENGKITGLF